MSIASEIAAYNAVVNANVSSQTDPNSIDPTTVGDIGIDLANLLLPYIEKSNNQTIFSGNTLPTTLLGADLDLYYYKQPSFFEIYRKEAGVWVLKVNVPFGLQLPDGNLTVRTSISGFIVTATKGGWIISNVVYQKATQTQLTVNAADLNFGRIDLIYADTSNNIIYLAGVAQSIPVAPAQPANTALIDQVIVPSQSSGNTPYLLFGGEDPSASGLNFADSTGLINGGILTINANPALFDVSAGTAFFVDFTNPLVPIKKTVSFGPTSGISVPGLTTSPSSYIGVDGNGNIVQQVTPFTNTQRRSIAILGILIHTNLTNINAINAQGSIILAPADQLHDFMNAVGPLNLTGNKYSAASNNLTIQKTAGTIFKFGCNSNDFTNPHVVSQPAENPVTFRYRTRNGEVSGDTTNIIPGSYDNAGVITAVGAGQFTIQHITMFQSGLTRIQYGQNLYTSLAEAQAAAFSESFAVESNIAENGIFRAYLILKGNSTDLSNTTTCLFLEVPKFGGTSGNAGSALTAANIIAALGYTPLSPTTGIQNQFAVAQGASWWINGNARVQSPSNSNTLTFNVNNTDSFISGANNGTSLTIQAYVKTIFSTTASIVIPVGTTAQRPTPVDGDWRKNTTTGNVEFYHLATATWRNMMYMEGVVSNAIINQNSATQTANFIINGFAISNRVITRIGTAADTSALHVTLQTTAGTNRIGLGLTDTETGSGNTGSNLFLIRYDDAGAAIDLVLKLVRSTGFFGIGGITTPSERITQNGRHAFAATTVATLSAGQAKNWAQTVDGVTRMHTIDDAGNTGQIIQSGYGLKMPQRSVSATTTITLADYNLACDATSGTITVNLPTAASASGYEFTVIKTDGSVNAVTIDPNGAETINGASSVANTAQYMSKTFYSNGTTWFVK